MSEVLRLEGISAGYGESIVLDRVSLSLRAGESMALLGRNGVGKSTLLMTIMGLTRVHVGALLWRGEPLDAVETYRRARLGIGWVPQERCIFPSLTVEEHLSAVQAPGYWDLSRIYATFPQLHDKRANRGNELSGGEQQMLAIARTLVLNPSLLLLDEPLEGLAPIVVQQLLGVIRMLVRQEGMSVILVEQHAGHALRMTERAVVLERGMVVHEAPSQVLLGDDEALHRYLAIDADRQRVA